MLALPDAAEPPAQTMTGWTPELDLLAGILESIQRLYALTVGVNSKDRKVPKVPPFPRPVSALDRVRKRREREQLAAVVEMFRPR